MSKIPQEYLDSTTGIKPAPTQESFNNIVYSTQNLIGHVLKASLDNEIIGYYDNHIQQNNTPEGLYNPKNSHDNITYKLLGSKVLNRGYEKNMSLLKACIDIGPRPYDWILYAYLMGSPIVRFIAQFFLFIPALQCVDGIFSAGKIRPKMFDKNIPRYKWWFLKKEFVQVKVFATYNLMEWIDYKGNKQFTRHMMNDGKHICLFKLLILKKESKVFAFIANICHNNLVKRFGDEYGYVIMKKYFEDQNHPNIELYKGIKDILKRSI